MKREVEKSVKELRSKQEAHIAADNYRRWGNLLIERASRRLLSIQ